MYAKKELTQCNHFGMAHVSWIFKSMRSSHPISPPTTGIVGGKTLGADRIGTHCQWDCECCSTCLSNSWLTHVQPLTRDGPFPHKGINTWALRAWGLDSVSLVAPDQPPQGQSNDLVTWFAGPSCLGLIRAPLTISKERLFE